MNILSRLFFAALLTILLLVACRRVEEREETEARTAPPAAVETPSTTDRSSESTAERMVPSPTQSPATTTGADAGSDFPAPTLFDVGWDDRMPFRSGLIPAEREALNGLAGASVYHIDIEIVDDLTRLVGRQEVRYTNQESVSLDAVYFRLFPNLVGGSISISSLRVSGLEAEPELELRNSALRVPLTPALLPGEQVVFGMDYSVTVPTEPGGSYGTFVFARDILALAHFYPMISVYDDEGWNVEIPPESGDVVYADSSFYLVRVTAPAGLVVAASGVEFDQSEESARQSVSFAGGPMRDFYVIASELFEVTSLQVGDTMVNSYTFPEFAEASERAATHAADALEGFNDRFGPYPFTEFDVVSSPPPALGVEYPGITVISLEMYDPASSPFPPVWFESTVAHEVGHQWFYSMVGNDQLDDPWLDESLTQYVTLLYFRDRYGAAGESGFRQSLVDRWERVDNTPIPISEPVAAYEGAEYSAIVYGRGALFFEALAETMGESDFNAFLREYVATHKWSIATPESLRDLAEAQCACDLTALFDEWVYT